MNINVNPVTFRHEFETGIGYEGLIVKDSSPSWLDRLLRRNAHYEKIELRYLDFKTDTQFGSGETRWVRKGTLDHLRMAHSFRKEEMKAWEACKEYVGKELIFSSSIKEDVLSDKKTG